MDTASPTPERITVRTRGGITSGTVVWRKPGKVRVALRTGKTRTFDAAAEWKPTAHNFDEATRREMFPRVYAKRDAEAAKSADVTVTAEELNLDFSVETMGHCHGVHMAPMFSKVWP